MPPRSPWPRPLQLGPRQQVYSAFFLYAMAMGGIFPRLGDIQQAMAITERALGLGLIGTASGTMIWHSCRPGTSSLKYTSADCRSCASMYMYRVVSHTAPSGMGWCGVSRGVVTRRVGEREW